MKLKQLLLISLAIVPLFSCGGSKNPVDPVIDYTVTKEEFNHALSWGDEDYIQIENSTPASEEGMTGVFSKTIKMAPNASSTLMASVDEKGFVKFFSENRIFKGGTTFNGFINYDEKKPNWDYMDSSDAKEEYCCPEEFNMLLFLEYLKLSYDDFTPTGVGEELHYLAEFIIDDPTTNSSIRETTGKLSFYFKDKKYVHLCAEVDDKSNESFVTYKKEDIIRPII